MVWLFRVQQRVLCYHWQCYLHDSVFGHTNSIDICALLCPKHDSQAFSYHRNELLILAHYDGHCTR